MIPFSGYYPDLDEHAEGLITNCTQMIPTARGYKGAPSPVAAVAALAAQCRGAAYITLLDNTTRLFAGTQTKIYEYSGSAWTDVSAGSYTGSADSAWRFIQWGNVTIAANKTDSTQKSITSGAFSALAGAPKALVGDSVGGYVMLGNYNNGTDTQDGVYWSAYQDYSDWTPSISTGCGYLRLYDTPGEIRALKRLGENAVVYKEQSMYLGVDSKSSTLWGFNLISSDIGALSQEAVVSIETAHFFLGKNDIYMYDGSRPVSIGDGIREWFASNLNANYSYRSRGVHDRTNSLIYWFFPSTASAGELDMCLVYNYKTNKWGRADRTVEACLEYLSGAESYTGLEADFPTYTDIESLSYGSPFWTSNQFNLSVFDATHTLVTLTGASASSSITTGALGDDTQLTLIKRVQPRLTTAPTSGTMTNYYRMTDGSSYTTDATCILSNGRFDVLRAARWHKVKTDYVGDVEVIGHTYKIEGQGSD